MRGESTDGDSSGFLIYLVDDEEMMLNLAEVALRKDGYRLKKFDNPQAALEAFAREPCKPSLLLTDFAMEPMDGLELSARCKLAHPGLKILLVSGTAGPEVVQTSAVPVDHFMQKPYKLSELSHTVRALLRTQVI